MASALQTVLFKRSKYTVASATVWLKKHKLKHYTHRLTKNFIRFRQKPPKKDKKFRYKRIDPYISFVFEY